MIPLLDVRLEAEADLLLEAYSWYEAERAGLGDEFKAKIKDCLADVLLFPNAQPYAGYGVRKARPKRFAYQNYYRYTGDAVVVFAVLHDKRNPALWKRRAQNEKGEQ